MKCGMVNELIQNRRIVGCAAALGQRITRHVSGLNISGDLISGDALPCGTTHPTQNAPWHWLNAFAMWLSAMVPANDPRAIPDPHPS
jgi:hypothetical protein